MDRHKRSIFGKKTNKKMLLSQNNVLVKASKHQKPGYSTIALMSLWRTPTPVRPGAAVAAAAATAARGVAAYYRAATRDISEIDPAVVNLQHQPGGLTELIKRIHGDPPCWLRGGPSPRMLPLCAALMRNDVHSCQCQWGFDLKGLPLPDDECSQAHLSAKGPIDFQSVRTDHALILLSV